MKKSFVLACLAASVAMAAVPAMADSIKGRVGVTGKIGFMLPANSDYGNFKIDTDAGIIGGGGFIYGIDNHFAAEIDVTRTEFGSNLPDGTNTGDFGVTNISLGGQYRFISENTRLVPYLGAGLDILLCDYDPSANFSTRTHDIDTTVGIHVSGGVDYFLMKQLALTAEAKALAAPDTDISNADGKKGNFDPSGVSGTFGVRFFFN